MANETRNIQADTISELHTIRELIATDPARAALYLSAITDDLSSSRVTIEVEKAPSSKMVVPVCRNTEDLISYNID
tara:strand:+ start:76 stop:303 length:228 start_codon:yes stop_codon:yes gene_type:complete